tara:strand:+ start:295 stop:1071 length:777 start_codon:yes stop_codon:yes gene_type:complete
MNQSPILLNIASHCDKDTFFNLMLVNKKAYQVVRYLLHSAPTVFILLYTQGRYGVDAPKQIIYKSLKGLYINLHQKEINNSPKKIIDIVHDNSHPAGKCLDCLKNEETFCWCEDYSYIGINMVKYISKNINLDILRSYEIEQPYLCVPKLKPLKSPTGFRIFKYLDINMVKNDYSCIRFKNPFLAETNYKSMEYLYQGIQKPGFKLRYDLKRNKKSYYPLTDDMFHLVDVYSWPDKTKKFDSRICHDSSKKDKFPRTI